MKKLLTILSAVAVSTTLVHAADDAAKQKAEGKKPMTAEERFDKLDKNHDGKLTMDELKESAMAKKDPAKAEANFKMMDKDNDGSVSKEEFTASAGMHKGAKGGEKAKPAGGAGKPESGTPATSTKPEAK